MFNDIIESMFTSSSTDHITLSVHEKMLTEKDAVLATKEELIEKQTEVIDSQKRRIAVLEEALRLSRHKAFAPSSEAESGQVQLFGADLPSANEPEETDTSANDDSTNSRKRKGGRKGLNPNIPREQVHIRLSDEEKEGAVATFFVVVKEELDKVPGRVRVLEYLQEKAVFKSEEGKKSIKTAEMPKHPLGKAVASINLLAFIIISKFMDHLPLYRLEGILKRYGGSITRATMANWLNNLSAQLQPLINLMREFQLQHDYLQADESTIKVLNHPGYKANSTKYIWEIRGGPPDKPCVTFAYDPSRKKEVATRLLDEFNGYLQVDGYEGYDEVCKKNGITRLGCMDHARRKFKEAQHAQPKHKDGPKKQSLADVGILKMQKLYKIEKRLRENKATVDETYAARQKESRPILEELKKWADENRHKVPKDSLTGKAFTYLCNQWPRLIVYCTNGRLHISNILAENSFRPHALGRKNWLFADSVKGAHAIANYYSLIESAKMNGIEPYDYFCHILAKLPYATTVEQLEELLPWNVKLPK